MRRPLAWLACYRRLTICYERHEVLHLESIMGLVARQLARLGVGPVLGLQGRTPEAIRGSVRAVMTNTAYRDAAGQVRDDMAALPGPENAVALLERLAAEQQPMLTA